MTSVFQTERLRAVPWRDDHAEVAHAAYSRAEFVRHLGNPTPHPDLAYTRAWIARIAESADPAGRRGFLAVELRTTGDLVGATLLQPLPGGDGEWEVGWHVFPEQQRQGYATEIGRAAIDYGFRNGSNEIFAVVKPENDASLAVARAVGMRPLGRTDRYYDVITELFVVSRDD